MLIGLTGRKRSGKDTFARGLVKDHGFVRLAFADRLKAALYELNPIIYARGYTVRDYVDALGWERAKEDRAVREVMQNFGVALRYHIGKDVWIRPVRAEVQSILDEGRSVVITDVRFRNEAMMVHDLGGALVHVVRPDALDDDSHISETGIPSDVADYTISNDRSVDELHRRASRLVTSLSS